MYFYCAAHCIDPDQPSQLSGCGIVIRFVDEDGRCKRRELAFALGGSDLSLAQIQSVRLALSSVRPGHRSYESHAYIDNDFVIDILASSISTKYKTAVSELRKWFGFFSNLRVVHDDVEHDLGNCAKDLAIQAAEQQDNFDSGSKDE